MRKDIFLQKEQIIKWINENKSKAFICRELKCKQETLNYWLIRFDIKYDGKKSWNKGMKCSRRNAMYYIENNFIVSAHKLKNLLIEDKIKERKCEECNNIFWNNKPIPIELHHIDGNRFNNKLENLQILCPNCHSQKDVHLNNIKDTSYDYLDKEIEKLNKVEYSKLLKTQIKKNKEKKIKEKIVKEKKHYYCSCGKEIQKFSKQCSNCYRISERKIERPSYDQLIKEIQESNYVQVGKKYGVSDNAIRKWIKNYKKMLS